MKGGYNIAYNRINHYNILSGVGCRPYNGTHNNVGEHTLSGVWRRPYTLHPTLQALQQHPLCRPYTLHHTIYALHPTPYTVGPTPYTLHCRPYNMTHYNIGEPTLSGVWCRPYTLHCRPYTLHCRPYNMTHYNIGEPTLSGVGLNKPAPVRQMGPGMATLTLHIAPLTPNM